MMASILAMSVHTRRQNGSVLLVTIIVLIAITMMSVVAMKSSILQEKLAAGAMDQNIAFQAAESALRDAEIHINADINANAGFNDACNNGLCFPSTSSISTWDAINNWKTSDKPIIFGSKTSASPMPDLALQPRYIIELLPNLPAGFGESSALGASSGGTAYRITAMGWGQRSTTQIMLQSIYIKI